LAALCAAFFILKGYLYNKGSPFLFMKGTWKMNKSTIDWTEYSWNPITGCTKASPGCKNCYAEKVAMWL
jgi:hypothetical protein